LKPEPVVLGRITGLFGVRGWVKVFSYTEPREAVLNYKHWLLRKQGEWQSATVAEGRRHGKTVIVRVEGFDDRDRSAELIGSEIGIPRSEMPEAGEGQYYWSDLEGMRVVHKGGSELGTVEYLLETGAHDVMVVTGEKERLIPFVRNEVIIDVDLDEGVITVDWEWE
jgi:16S rRNA processing protein RimM